MKYVRSSILAFIFILCCISTAFADILGAGWFTCDCSLGTGCTITVPANTGDFWGVDDSNGSLVNCGSSTVSGTIRTSQGTVYSWRCASLSSPEYRQNGTSYTWTPLNCFVTDSSFTVATNQRNAESWQRYSSLIQIGLMGVIIVCLMRFKH